MKNEFLIKDITPGKLNALVKIIMQQTGVTDPEEAVRLVNSGDYIVMLPPLWSEDVGIIPCSVVSDGTTPFDWHERLKKNFQIGYNARLILLDNRAKTFIPTNGIKTKIAILHGKLFAKKDRTFAKIKEFAQKKNMLPPNGEVGCLLREEFTNDAIAAMGLRAIIVMHEPLMAPYVFGSSTFTNPYYLDISIDSAEHGGYLSEVSATESNSLPDSWGFAFLIPD